MSSESAYKFMEQAYNDETFRKELQKEGNVDGLVARAREAGYDFTAQELQSTAIQFYEDKGIELSEDQLEAAAGGVIIATIVVA